VPTLETKRLQLIPFSLDLKKAALNDRSRLIAMLGVDVPEHWPGPDLAEALPLFIENMERAPSEPAWDWIAIHTSQQAVIGDIGFMGGPDQEVAQRPVRCHRLAAWIEAPYVHVQLSIGELISHTQRKMIGESCLTNPSRPFDRDDRGSASRDGRLGEGGKRLQFAGAPDELLRRRGNLPRPDRSPLWSKRLVPQVNDRICSESLFFQMLSQSPYGFARRLSIAVQPASPLRFAVKDRLARIRFARRRHFLQHPEGQSAGIDEPTQLSVKVLLCCGEPSRKRGSLLIDIAHPELQAGNDDYAASGARSLSPIVPVRTNLYQLVRTGDLTTRIRVESRYRRAAQRNRGGAMGRGDFGCHKITRPAASEDDLLAFILICTWVLSTGRSFPEVQPRDMTEQQLIDFWAEDQA